LNVYKGSYVLKTFHPTVRVPDKNVVVTDQSPGSGLIASCIHALRALYAEDGTALPELQELRIVPSRLRYSAID
jgi:hypothetical protein